MRDLGLPVSKLGGRLGVPRLDLERMVRNDWSHVSVDDVERVAFRLGLDEASIAFRPYAAGDERIAHRLRVLQTRQGGHRDAELNPGAVLSFAEAASVIRIQHNLQAWLGFKSGHVNFQPSNDYGSSTSPAWQVGYMLAEEARRALGLNGNPIESLRELTEKILGIPVVQAELSEHIAGATIACHSPDGVEVRGVVLNVKGANENPWVRRATLAHELGHLLFDPEQELQSVRVDTYEGISSDPSEIRSDFVEQRANAFAVAFLAPLDVIRQMMRPPLSLDDLVGVMERFGISYTAARYHIHNAWYRSYDLPVERPSLPPSDEWRAAENFTIDYFPIEQTPISRRGRFAGFVVACLNNNLLSLQSAANYLACTPEQLEQAAPTIADIHPIGSELS